tara:strand:+ start:5692 stop:6198 length:507 start_codon:yes stop_codon:yes gene_type:complete
MAKTFVCTNCKQRKGEAKFELKLNKNGTKSRMRKCNDCTASSRRYITERKSYFSKICSAQKYMHSSGKRAPKGLAWAIDPEYLLDLFDAQKGRCGYSGVLMTTFRDGTGSHDLNASIDRIDPEQGYTKDNIHLVCYRVNLMKHSLSEPMFDWWLTNIYRHHICKETLE